MAKPPVTADAVAPRVTQEAGAGRLRGPAAVRTVVTLSGAAAAMAAEGLLTAIAAVAEAALEVPPWNEPAASARLVADRLRADADVPGFVLAVALALAARGAALDGFACGVPRWHLAEAAAALRLAADPPFEFCELAVRPVQQGRGTGVALQDAIVAASGPRRRWLATHAGARPALTLYRTRGWQAARLVPGPGPASLRILMNRPR